MKRDTLVPIILLGFALLGLLYLCAQLSRPIRVQVEFVEPATAAEVNPLQETSHSSRTPSLVR